METFNTPEEIKLAEERKKFLAGVKPEDIADHFPLFIDRQNLARYLARYEIFKKILGVKGSIVECGVHKGASLMLYAKLSAAYEPYAYNREIIGFDTFAGFPSVDKKDGSFAYVNCMADADLDILKKSIEFYDKNRPIGHLPKVRLVEGDATKTIPDFFSKNPWVIVAMLYLDFDIYEPTKAALQTILPRMPKGAIIVFDELNEARWAGETVAMLETLNINKFAIKKFPEEAHISYLVI